MDAWLDWAERLVAEHPGRAALGVAAVFALLFGSQLKVVVQNLVVALRLMVMVGAVLVIVQLFRGPAPAAPKSVQTNPQPQTTKESPAANNAWIEF